MPFYVVGKGWCGFGVGSRGRDSVGMALGMLIVKAPAESLVRVKAVEVASLVVVRHMTWLRLLQTVGHRERDQLH